MSQESPSKKTILVVEDDSDARETLCLMLERLGYNYLSFESAVPVLEAIRGKEIDLALIDIMMPIKDGYELLQDLRNTEEFSSLPVFFVTAKDANQQVIDGYKTGADYYIMKPFTKSQLEYGLKLFLEKDKNEGTTGEEQH